MNLVGYVDEVFCTGRGLLCILLLCVVHRISIPEQVQFSGNIVGESAMHTEVDIGSQVIHRYQVVVISVIRSLFWDGAVA